MSQQLKKNIFWSALPALLFSSTIAVAAAPTYDKTTNPIVIKPAKNKQVGAAIEERASFVDGYLFFNHLVNKKFFYELRALYIHNYILATPTTPAGLPSITNQENLDGTGGVGIFGYHFQVNPSLTAMPFIRLQYYTNTVAAYKDDAGNELDSDSFTSYLGLKLGMKVSDAFSVAALYFGGYQTSNLYGKGLFATSGRPKVFSWTSTMELDFPYKMAASWILTPYLQWITTGNNPNAVAFAAPIRQSGATSTTALYAFRLAYVL